MQATWYEIRIRGTLGPESADWSEGMEVRREGQDQTILAGWIVDQAALHGLLARVRNLNLTLLSVNSKPSAVQGESQGEQKEKR